MTNLDGKYTIEINKGNTLTFSLIGMQTQDIKIASQSIINVIMHESTIELDEVVAIGYGTAKKSDLTSSIISVKPDELKNVKVGSAADALQGLATGVLISKGSFKPGGSSNIIIRGNGSFGNGGASTTPLYIIDGVMSNAGLGASIFSIFCRSSSSFRLSMTSESLTCIIGMLSLLPISNRLRY